MNTRSVLVLLVSLVLVFGLYGPAETQEDISGQEVASGPAASDVPDVPDATGESDASDETDVPDESDEADTSPSDETVSEPSVSPEKTAFEPDLESFGAVALNDMSLCQEDEGCLEEVAMIKSWVCISKACRSKKDPTFKAVECLGKVNDTGKPDALSLAMCDYARSSDPEKRKEFLSHAVKTSPNATEDALVQIKAYLMALKGKRKDCVNLVFRNLYNLIHIIHFYNIINLTIFSIIHNTSFSL